MTLREYRESYLEEGKLANILKFQGSVFQNATGRGVHIHFFYRSSVNYGNDSKLL